MVPFGVRKATNVVAAQFDLAYNTSKATLHFPELAARFTNHVIRSREIAPGVRRVLVYSRQNALLRTNNINGTFAVDIPAQERVGSGPLIPQNVVLAGVDRTSVQPVTTKSGTVFVTPVYRHPLSGVVDLFFPSQADRSYGLEATTDFIHWVNLGTSQAVGDFLDFVDLDAPNYPQRFYRATPITDSTMNQIDSVSLTMAGTVMSFNWSGQIGSDYILQSSKDLVEWVNLRTNSAAEAVISYSIPIEAASTHRFFRVRSK